MAGLLVVGEVVQGEPSLGRRMTLGVGRAAETHRDFERVGARRCSRLTNVPGHHT